MDIINIWLQKLQTPTLTNIVNVITFFGGPLGIILVYLIISLFKDSSSGAKYLLFVLVNFAICFILKISISSPRPYVINKDIKNLIWSGYSNIKDNMSFPSGHSASFSFSIFYLIFEFKIKKRYQAPLIILSFIIPLTRLYLGVHNILDVIAGYLIGFNTAYIISLVKVFKKIKFEKEHILIIMPLAAFLFIIFTIKEFMLKTSLYLGFFTIYPLILYYEEKDKGRTMILFRCLNILISILIGIYLYLYLPEIVNKSFTKYITGIIFAISFIPSVIIKETNMYEVNYEKIKSK